MGIKGLWPMLTPVARRTTLHRFSIEEGFIGNVGAVRALRVGIDASAWIFRASYRHGSTKSPELATIFARCCRLLRLPILPLFVFDGPGRPKMKRGKKVKGNPHWLTQDMKELLDALSFPWIEAPGEAEAELAWLSRAHRIDAVVTEDSDAMIFGASTVLCLITEDNGNEMAMVYHSADIASHPGLQLRQPDLLLIALLAGGDYSVGLRGCGINTSFALARAGLGCSLVKGMLELGDEDPTQFLAEWRGLLIQELRDNCSGTLAHPLPILADSVPPEFPDAAIIEFYLRPDTSEHDDAPDGRINLLPSQDLNLARLAQFVEDNFVWRDFARVYRRFATDVFPGLAIKQLVCSAFASDLHFPPKACSLIGNLISLRRPSQSTIGHLPEVRVNLIVNHQITAFVHSRAHGPLCRTLTDDEVIYWIDNNLPRIRAWLPLTMIELVQPQLLPGAKALSIHQSIVNTSYTSPQPSGSNSNTEVIDLTQMGTPEPNNITYADGYRIVISTCPESRHDILEFFSDSE